MILLLIRTNLLRRPFRNAVLALCVASVAGLQTAAWIIDHASKAGLERGLERLGADLVAVPRGAQDDLEDAYITGDAKLHYMPRSIQDKIADFPFVDKTSPQLYIKSLTGASCCSAWSVFLIGFDPRTDFTIRPWLDMRPGRTIGPDQVLLGAALGGEPGMEMKFYGHKYEVAGVLEPSGMGLDSTVFIPIDTAYLMATESSTKAEKTLELTRDQISAVLIKVVPKDRGGKSPAMAAFELERAIPEISVIQRQSIVERVDKNISGTLGALRSASYSVWPVTALLIGLVFAMAANERGHEIGLLRAVGSTRWFVFRLIVFEALAIAGAGALAGLIASVGLVGGFGKLIAKSLSIPFYWPPSNELIGVLLAAFCLALLTAAAAAFLPALQAARMEPYEAIRR